MVPIGLQLMLCPPRKEGHIPPVICASFLWQLPEGAVCCGTKAAQKFRAEAKFLNPFENDSPAVGSEEVAVMQYIDAWLRMTSTEQLECVSALVGRVLVTDSMPGKINHVHFLAAMVADYVKKGLVVTSADVAQIPREALVPRAQAVIDTTANSKRGWLQHVREAARKWSRPTVKLAPRPKPEARPQPKAKAKPAVKRRPGALKSAILATAATAVTSSPREVPLMHTQVDFNRFVIKVAPEGSSQGFQIPYVKDLINMEPCTLWGKFLLKEREEYAFAGPQVRACMRQQPGALSSRRPMQPLLAPNLGKEAAFQCGIRVASSSWIPSTRRPSLKTCRFQQRGRCRTKLHLENGGELSHRSCRDEQQVAANTEAIKDECSSPPAQPGRQHFALVITIMHLTRWQDSMLPQDSPKGHNW